MIFIQCKNNSFIELQRVFAHIQSLCNYSIFSMLSSLNKLLNIMSLTSNSTFLPNNIVCFAFYKFQHCIELLVPSMNLIDAIIYSLLYVVINKTAKDCIQFLNKHVKNISKTFLLDSSKNEEV